jgi:osmotically-inducible protein OsmY
VTQSNSCELMPFAESQFDTELSNRVQSSLGTLRLVARNIDAKVGKGAVVVEGTVRSFYERQLAIACVRRVAGVRQVVDLIHVTNDPIHSAAARPRREEVLL